MIPSVLLNSLYTVGSLRNTRTGAQFAIKNRLSDAELVGVGSIAIDGHRYRWMVSCSTWGMAR